MSVIVIAIILLQAKGSGLGGMFGGESGVTRTRRGLEKTLYQTTIVLSILFFFMSLLTVTFIEF